MAEDVVALLSEDLLLFVEREVKGVRNNPQFAAKMTDDTLQALKEDVRSGGLTGRDEVASD